MTATHPQPLWDGTYHGKGDGGIAPSSERCRGSAIDVQQTADVGPHFN